MLNRQSHGSQPLCNYLVEITPDLVYHMASLANYYGLTTLHTFFQSKFTTETRPMLVPIQMQFLLKPISLSHHFGGLLFTK
jgi:hypothetical protein